MRRAVSLDGPTRQEQAQHNAKHQLFLSRQAHHSTTYNTGRYAPQWKRYPWPLEENVSQSRFLWVDPDIESSMVGDLPYCGF
jgi:hypothetical protein